MNYGAYGTNGPRRVPRYDLGDHEAATGLERRTEPWSVEDVYDEIRRRAAVYRDRRELIVDYYRIGFHLAFPLPLKKRPTELPVGVIGDRPYPWLIWLGWELEERWRIFAAADRMGADGSLLADELTALASWSSYDADYGGAGLVTAALASPLCDVLERGGPSADLARTVGERIVGESITRCAEAWKSGPPYQLTDMHNIRCITLFRGAQLASAVGSPGADVLQRRALQVFRSWVELRAADRPLVEGSAYDGYLLDSMTDWLQARPDADELAAEAREPLTETVVGWAHLALPGRPDLLAPLGDTEGEMPYWTVPALRISRWLGRTDLSAWLRRLPLARIPAAGLTEALTLPDGDGAIEPDTHDQLASRTHRTGWDTSDLLVAVAAGRTPMGHLHLDGGHVVIGWHGRCWITDPGYQQYRPGIERDYSIGTEAHNAPVIGGHAQSVRAVVRAGDGLDLGACYEGLPADAVVRRRVRLDADRVVVTDEISGVPDGTEVTTHWLGGAGLGWAFVDGWARLSDGQRAFWIAWDSGEITAGQLGRHDGSRGPLRLRVSTHARGGALRQQWSFVTDTAATWNPPSP